MAKVAGRKDKKPMTSGNNFRALILSINMRMQKPISPRFAGIVNFQTVVQPPWAHPHSAPNAIGMERGCVQSTSRSTWKGSEASGIFQLAGFAKLLRLVFDTAALRGQCADAPSFAALCVPGVSALKAFAAA
jgi:hypothetical protein